MEEPADMPTGSDNASPRRGEAARQLDGTEAEWRYRGRNDPEPVGAQPMSAPTGLAAQKDEGFQRFYRAVVSPTHVRVTAGGRIVPNTRGSPSPTTRWPKDKPAGEAAENNTNRQPNREVLQQGQFALPQPVGFFPHHAMIPGFAPGMVPAMHGMPGMPAMPPMPAMAGMPAGAGPYPFMWPMGFNMGTPMGMAPSPHMMGHVPGLVAMPPPNPNSATNDKQSEAAASENATPTRAPAAENGDAARPVVHNGQWMVPPGAVPHFAMGPHPGFLGPPMMSPMGAGHRFVPNHVMAPVAQSNGQTSQMPQHQAMAMPPPMAFPMVQGLAPAPGQHHSSIRASQITKKQLSVLRASLRWAEDQLQYNKHQIDERTMELHAQSLRNSIEHFEKIRDEQVANEQRNLPKDQAKENTSKSVSADEERSKSPPPSSAKPENSVESASSLPEESFNVRVEKQKSMPQHSTLISSQENNAVQLTSTVQTLSISETIGANKKSSTLPINAALAPPFQPRAVGGQATCDGLAYSVASLREQNATTKPYLVGLLPAGVSAEKAVSTDYVYPRTLTEEERRARHMYWGNTPHDLQRGLPKFDGKDFYPPSPATSPKNESRHDHEHDFLAVKAPGIENGGKNASTDADPFQSSRREHQHRRGAVGISVESDPSQLSAVSNKEVDSLPVHVPSQDSGKNGISKSRYEITTASSPNAPSESDSPDENDDKSIVFKGRNSLRQTRQRPRSGIWHDMMKRGTSSSNAVPGTISSTTAQGVLPHYGGHATASLAPTATNISSSPREHATKSGNPNDGSPVGPVTERQIENRPPGVQGSKRRHQVL
ncbi:hypothetical protein BBK36DRAFT_1110687 [Trichoderma citrinoviride]|uniref:Uncharacterized protein n=1 Tax=Trichoderma citrinoviride TaxID=58853 RepID=A0A2T4BL32_9HYPO|nr:hypothetical protein BBK36DRAFT_1110687 [Trichoderma citrinoviride]PTB70026.1 hypothetical protein BBK36DRAFT_1110687 [Trichoderma citrinoviride]